MNRREFGASLAAVAALSKGAPAAGREHNLVVMPVPNEREVMIVPPRRPHCFVRHLNLEDFACRNWRDVPDSSRGLWGVDHHWEWREDGTIGCTGPVAPGVAYTLDIVPRPETLQMRLAVENRGDKTLEDLYGLMCLDVRRNSMMYDATLERSYVESGGGAVPMSRTDVAGSYNRVMPAYFLQGTSDAEKWLPEMLSSYGWAISRTELDSPLAAVVSHDGSWVAGLWFTPCKMVLGNAKPVHHGCVHSEPAFGTLAPGRSASATGRLYIAQGGLEQVWKRMREDWKAARA
jgi:hypothetical protein